MPPATYRPRFGRWLCGLIWLICLFGFARELAEGGGTGWQLLPWVLLVSLAVWATYWRPMLRVDDGGVRFVNVVRTIDIPWPAIRRIDTKWALTLYTEYGTYTSWAAPAPGVRSTVRARHVQRESLPETAITYQSVRPGDLPGTSSGDAAAAVRRRWEALRDAGHLDDPRLEFARVPMKWHWETLAAALALAIGCGVTLLS